MEHKLLSNSNEFFPDIGSVAEETEVSNDGSHDDRLLQEIESLCMKCEHTGVTRMLLTSIPFFREVIVMSFRCESCGNHNNEMQSAGTIGAEGMIYTVRILCTTDLNRQIVRSPTCSIMIPEYQLTLPASRGQLTTVEGLISNIIADLDLDQPLRRVHDESAFGKIETLLASLRSILRDIDAGGDEARPAQKPTEFHPFTVQLDDPAGNSFIEFFHSMSDPSWSVKTYTRTHQQDVDLGLAHESNDLQPDSKEGDYGIAEPEAEDKQEKNLAQNSEREDKEVYIFPGICPNCGQALHTRMKKVVIPYFKDIFIMSTNCDICGYRDNEIKSGSAISERGKRITLKVQDSYDLSRDILKSDTAGLAIPEIDLVLEPGTLGGRFTTLEGILEQVYEELSKKILAGDSSTISQEDRRSFDEFLDKLNKFKSGEQPFTLVLDDPLANSYIQNLFAPDPDPNLNIEVYERSWQQNEDLGLNDMKVKDYQGSS